MVQVMDAIDVKVIRIIEKRARLVLTKLTEAATFDDLFFGLGNESRVIRNPTRNTVQLPGDVARIATAEEGGNVVTRHGSPIGGPRLAIALDDDLPLAWLEV